MLRSLSVVMVCLLLTSCATSQHAAETAEIEIRQASDRFWATRERRDAAALAAQFTETASFMVPGLRDATGRTAILELLQKRFAGLRTTDFKVQRREIEI